VQVLITGVAGFIGYHLADKMLKLGYQVLGIDNLNDYYDPSLKKLRLENLVTHKESRNFKFLELDISCRNMMEDIFRDYQPEYVIHLAAQAGVRYSLENPHSYADSNLIGFLNLLEGCRCAPVKHLVYASSSSVYGMNKEQPFNTSDRVDYPVSLYAATKKANELMAFSYSHLYKIPSTGLRFFTVYGPYGRPDMAYYKFTKSILNGTPIDVYNFGDMLRDFTYIDDIIDGVLKALKTIPIETSSEFSNANAPYKIYNIGNNKPITLSRFICAIESACGVQAKRNFLPMQSGDVPLTYAEISDFSENTGFVPKTEIESGILSFVNWYKDFVDTEDDSGVSG